MRVTLVIAAALCAALPSVVHGQVLYNQQPSASIPRATTDTIAAAQQAATDAKAQADAAVAAMPRPATAAPQSERIGAATGTVTTRFALEDHQHPRLTSTTYATLDALCQAAVPFSRTFVNKPGLNLTETDATASSQTLNLRGITWTRDGAGLYTGVTIQGKRSQMLPTINPLSGTLTLVSGVVSGINTALAQLTNYDVMGGNCAGATISVIAVARSDVASN